MSRSNYAVSDFLVDRHPENTEKISGEIDPKENTVAYGKRAVPKLISLLRVDSLSVQESQDALKTVLSLNLANQELKAYAVQQDIVETIKGHLKSQDSQVRALALTILGKLCNLKSAQERMDSDLIIPLVLDSINDSSPNVCIAACNTLQSFSTTLYSCSLLVNYKAISYLVSVIMNTTLDQALGPCLEVFAALTSASDDAIIAALACDSLPALQHVISHRPDLVVKCCCNLSKHMQGKEAMVKANMLPTFAGLLHHQSHPVQQRALSAIMLLCVVVDAKKQALEIPMLIDHLVYILLVGEDGHEMDVQYAKATLILISEYPKGRQEVEKCIEKYGGEKESEIRKLLFPKNA